MRGDAIVGFYKQTADSAAWWTLLRIGCSDNMLSLVLYYDEWKCISNKTTMMTYRDESLGCDSGDVTTWLYDEASSCMTNKVYADGLGPKYEYDANGRITKRTWARGVETFYAYDGWGNLTNTAYSDETPTISLAYDAMGRQREAHDAAGVTTFAYDNFGSLNNEAVVGVAGTNVIERHWDEFGRTAGYALNGVRQTTIAYDPATARIASMLANGSSNAFEWAYLDGSDLKSRLLYPNGLAASWQYDANGQLLQVCNAFPTNVVSQYDYVYDAAGRRVSCAKSGNAFTQNDISAYGYNEKGELTNAVAAVDSDYRYSYAFDGIGNRESANERGTNSVYTANSLNQYTQISNLCDSATLREEFHPQFDDDGNQVLVKTATGVWSVTYNGENRPILWAQGAKTISMSYDRQGRRVTKNDQRFVYNGYLQIANFDSSATNSQPSTRNFQLFIWDSTEPVATHPLVWNFSTFQPSNLSTSYYTHDGNKNVSEVVLEDVDVVAHYEYAPFGAETMQSGTSSAVNPWRFSSEYADDTLGLVYYNFRCYNPLVGLWVSRDPSEELGCINLTCFCVNNPICLSDLRGLGYFECLGDCIAANDILDKMLDNMIAKALVSFPGVPKVFLEFVARYVMRNQELADEIRLARKLGGPLGWKPWKIISDWLSLNKPLFTKVAKANAIVSTVYGCIMAAVEVDCAIHCIGECSYDGENVLNLDNAIEYYSEMLTSLLSEFLDSLSGEGGL